MSSAKVQLRHIEMYDGKVFCGARDGREYDGILQDDWHDAPVLIGKANCRGCLEAVYRLGHEAKCRLSVLEREGWPDYEDPPIRTSKAVTLSDVDVALKTAWGRKP